MPADLIPRPYVAFPTQQWDGGDGNWSTFRISVGSEPGQNFRVLVSTKASTSWVPAPLKGCTEEMNSCPSLRGIELFNSRPSLGFQTNSSDTWDNIGVFSLDLEKNLGFHDHGASSGYDTVHLGFGDDTHPAEIQKALVVTTPEPDYWMGLLGLNTAETTINNENTPSLLKALNDTGRIPSLSYGYTAGAYYRHPKVPGSLVIGGYDQSRFQPPSYEFHITEEDPDRPLSVGLQSVHTNFSLVTASSDTNLVDGHTSYIDSTVSQLWLPRAACDNFAVAFGLDYDAEHNYYKINDTIHNRLLAKNPILQFRLGKNNFLSPNDSIRIDLPYAAFDHYIGLPAYDSLQRYFPIRQAQNDSQYTIGRVFLQAAYLTVDYEHHNFSIAKANFSDTIPNVDIRTIYSSEYHPPASSPSLSGGAKAGITIGVIAGFLLLFSAVYLYWWRPRKQKKETHKKRPSVASQAPTYQSTVEPPPHCYSDGKPYDPWTTIPQQQQVEHKQHSVSEMPAGTDNMARRPELDGAGVGGSSYELPAPVKEREDDVVVYEMDVNHSEPTDDQGNADVGGEEVGRRQSEQMRRSEQGRASQVASSPA